MNFSNKWLNWRAVALLSVLVMLGLGAGWVLHRVEMKKRNAKLWEVVFKYGGDVEQNRRGDLVEYWLVKLGIAEVPHRGYSSRIGELYIFGKPVVVRSYLSDPFAVEISGSPAIDDLDLKMIASFGTIRALVLPVSTLGDPQSKIIGGCNNLEYLNLSGVSFSDEGFAHLGNLTRLRGFTFSDGVLSDQACRVLLKMKRLTHLEIKRTSFTVEGLQLLVKEHPSLQEIIISERFLTPDDLQKIGQLNPDLKIILTPVDDPFKSLGRETIFHSQK